MSRNASARKSLLNQTSFFFLPPGARDSRDDETPTGGVEQQQATPRQDAVSRSGSLRRLPRR